MPKRASKSIAEDMRSEQGAYLLLISLGVFFLSSLLLYAIYVGLRLGSEQGELIPFYLPPSFLLTTVVLIAVSIVLHLAVGAVRREKQIDFTRYIVIAFVLSFIFFVTQGLGLSWMVQQLLQPHNTMTNLYGFTLFLVIVHALHVIGGVAGLTFLLFGIARKSYDHERHFPVRFCAMYWHFLDAVWIIMLVCFASAAYISKLPRSVSVPDSSQDSNSQQASPLDDWSFARPAKAKRNTSPGEIRYALRPESRELRPTDSNT